MKWLAALVAATVLTVSQLFAASDGGNLDLQYPFRTDSANASLPWYVAKPLEFPPLHSARSVTGELVSADFLHRSGQFRTSRTGELISFYMPPYASIHYLNSEADLRDIPLGTSLVFLLNQDDKGNFNRLATMQDQFSVDASQGFSYRLDELKPAQGKLLVTKHNLLKSPSNTGKQELATDKFTRLWKADKQVTLSDLVVGDDLLINTSGNASSISGTCTDIWIGAGTQKKAADVQRKKFAEFTKKRGLPGWVEKTEGNQVVVTLFSGDAATFKEAYMNDIAAGKDVNLAVANDELRTWNPPTDKEKSQVLEIQNGPQDCYGSSGVRVVLKVSNMLEGFRKGRVVRLFGSGWIVKDQPYAESLMGYGYGKIPDSESVENTAKEYPAVFPYRTDFGNESLPWFQLKAGEPLPEFSEHRMMGEWVKAGAADRTGVLRAEVSGKMIPFTLIPGGVVMRFGAEAALADIPVGSRCRVNMYKDEHGEFTRAALISDEYSYLTSNSITFRIEALQLESGKLLVARQLPEVKNYNGDMEKPADIGRQILLVDNDTHVHRNDSEIPLKRLAVGDTLRCNVTSEQIGKPSRCTDLWVGEESFKLISDTQKKKSPPIAKK